MKVFASTDKERFYIENLIRLKLGYDLPDDLEIRAERRENSTSISYNIALSSESNTAFATSSASIMLHKSRTKALLASLGKAVFEVSDSISIHPTPYGILTGVRPVKIYLYYLENGYNDAEIHNILKNEYLIRDDKIYLLEGLAKTELNEYKKIDKDDYFLYVSIPFCPSRCSYCSFVSQTTSSESNLISDYLFQLKKEIRLIGEISDQKGKTLRGIYFGGGTPGILSSIQFDDLITEIKNSIDFNRMTEFTVECGRPETISKEKLTVLKSHGVGRISINPQTTNDDVLKNIGRNHTSDDFFSAFEIAKQLGFDSINSDLIVGLDGDSIESFKNSIRDLIKLECENITVHTLYRKRASSDTLNHKKEFFSDTDIDFMVSKAYSTCIKNQYLPYYLYRQKGTSSNLENIGYSKQNKYCLYNIAMMEDISTVISCGAGGVSKIYKPLDYGKIVNIGDTYQPLTRFSSYKYPNEYIKNFDKTLQNIELLKSIL